MEILAKCHEKFGIQPEEILNGIDHRHIYAVSLKQKEEKEKRVRAGREKAKKTWAERKAEKEKEKLCKTTKGLIFEPDYSAYSGMEADGMDEDGMEEDGMEEDGMEADEIESLSDGATKRLKPAHSDEEEDEDELVLFEDSVERS